MTRTQIRNDLTVSILDDPIVIENFRLLTSINDLLTTNHYLIDDLFNMKYLYFTVDNTKFEISTVESYSNLKNKVTRRRNKDEDVLFFVDISGKDRVFISESLDTELCGIRKKRSKLLKSLN